MIYCVPVKARDPPRHAVLWFAFVLLPAAKMQAMSSELQQRALIGAIIRNWKALKERVWGWFRRRGGSMVCQHPRGASGGRHQLRGAGVGMHLELRQSKEALDPELLRLGGEVLAFLSDWRPENQKPRTIGLRVRVECPSSNGTACRAEQAA